MSPLSSDEQAVGWVREQVDAWVAEAITLRKVKLPGVGDSPGAFHTARMKARTQLDRLEEILSECMALHGMLSRRYEAANNKLTDDFDTELGRRKQKGLDGDYTSGREREAMVNLALREKRQAVRDLKELLSYVRETLDRLWLKYNGLRGTKGDLADELKYLTWESHLER